MVLWAIAGLIVAPFVLGTVAQKPSLYWRAGILCLGPVIWIFALLELVMREQQNKNEEVKK
jgi:hypothetical protein